MTTRLFAAALLLTSAAAFAQEAPRAQETIEVTLRNVDVVVTDSKGNRVTGLTKDDLQLFENGQPREITNFSEVRRGATTGATEPPPRRIAIVFDMITLSMPAKRQAVDAARKFVAANLRPTDLAAVYMASNSFVRVVDWTSDANAIGAALERVNAEAASPTAMSRQLAERQIRAAVADAQQIEGSHRRGGGSPASGGDPAEPLGGGGTGTGSSSNRGTSAPPSGGGPLTTFRDIVGQARQFAQTEYRDVEHSISVMNAVMAAFGAASGRKALIVAGGGLPTRPGADLFQYVQNQADSASRGELGASMSRNAGRTSMIETSQFDTTPMIRSFATAAVRKGVTVYALDTEMGGSARSDISRADRSDVGADFMGVASRVDGYQMLANLTGGVALLGGSAATSMTEIAKDLDSYYSVAYRATGESDDAPKIDVKAKNGYRARASLASLPPTRDNVMRDQVTANNIEKQPNDLSISLLADPPVAAEDGRRTVAVKVLIPVKSLKLVREGDVVTGGFNVYVSTADEKGNTSDVTKQTHEIKWPADALAGLLEKNITYKINVTLEPGRSQISVGVIDQRSEVRGFDRIGV